MGGALTQLRRQRASCSTMYLPQRAWGLLLPAQHGGWEVMLIGSVSSVRAPGTQNSITGLSTLSAALFLLLAALALSGGGSTLPTESSRLRRKPPIQQENREHTLPLADGRGPAQLSRPLSISGKHPGAISGCHPRPELEARRLCAQSCRGPRGEALRMKAPGLRRSEGEAAPGSASPGLSGRWVTWSPFFLLWPFALGSLRCKGSSHYRPQRQRAQALCLKQVPSVTGL